MGLKEALEAQAKARPGYQCSVCKLIDELPHDEAQALMEALGSPLVHGSMIARALQSEGHDVKQNTVQRHRRGDCAR